ncbi:biopolymer transport protein ExbB [Roseimicrobium gellanilyticum]|uniref:Biopolymer transport protein ExbB n=1 Tax=Roseimicrobium gellanilyticum TaxID=748857 RepID=A0A366HBB8_9BACT|nr:MotA/TolQ/ExbB proton channel family protein [Roseimicrobium gellanilyticum]RBP39651.1 biopolymer transport protein ExbB [Roseimicrobium gellanilyticum]
MPDLELLASVSSGIDTVWNFVRGGGEVMILIGLCSLASVTIIIIKALQLRDGMLFPPKIVEEIKKIENYASTGDISPLQDMLEEDGSVAAQLGIIAISGKHETREENNEACETAARGIMHRLEEGIPILEVIVTVSPLLGLLGAVVGLVTVFGSFGGQGTEGDNAMVAKGIAEALHSTIAGLLVAIPTVIAHGYFSRKLDAISVRMELILRHAIHDFHRHFEVKRAMSR